VRPGRLGIALLLSVPDERVGELLTLSVRLEGPGGELVGLADRDAELEGTLMAEAPPEDWSLGFQLVPLAFNLDELLLEQEGAHVLIVEVDGQPGARVPFAVSVG
jgi:hypothetical protein